MKINYILSDTIKYATTKALEEVVKRAESNLFDDYIVIVPETKSIAVEREILSLSKSKAVANIYVYSFVRLLNRFGLVSQDKVVSKQTCIMIIKKIISENADKLMCYKKTSRSVGFAEKIYDTIQQFKSSEVFPEDLKKVALTCTKSLKLKLEDIIYLYEEYEKTLKDRFFDDCDKLNLLVNFAKTEEKLKRTEVFVVGFDNITYEMGSVLKEFAKNAKEITFSSVYFNETREDKHLQRNELYNKFKHIADELKYPYVPKFYEFYAKGDFYTIKNHLFATKKHEAKPAGNLSLFEARNKRHEIEYVASKIIDEVKAGKRFRDICVYSPNLSAEINLFEKYFTAFDIPYYIKRDYNLSSHPLISFISNVFELEKSHYSSEKVLKFLSNAYVDNQNYAEFENFVNETGINYGLFVKDFDVKYEDALKNSRIEKVLSFIKSHHAQFGEKIKNAKTIKDYVMVTEEILNTFDVEKKTESFALSLQNSGLVEEAEVYRKVLNKILELLKSLVNFMGDMKVSSDEFLQIFMSGFMSIKINLTPMSADSVLIQDSIDGFYDVKDLFIVGANEGSFPAKLVDSGIVLDAELEEAKKAIQKPIEPTIKQINSRENYSVYETMLLPSDKLFVSYSLRLADGTEGKPAMVVNNILKLYGEDFVVKSFKSNSSEAKNICVEKFAEHVNEYLKGEYNLDLLNKEYSKIESLFSERYLEAVARFNNENISFEIDNPEDIYFSKNTTSISQLEKYFACPYKFFASYGLRLKENKNSKLKGADVGTIIHRIAELFVKDIETIKVLDEGAINDKIADITSIAFAEQEVNEKQNMAVVNFVKKEAVRLCRYILFEQSLSSYKTNPKLNEYSFSGEKAVELELENGKKINIEGKIDRVDECSNYKRIIDYKTGDISSDLSSVYYGKKIQLVSYLMASDKMSNKKIAGLFYFPIHSDFVKNNEKVQNLYKLQGFLLDDIEVIKRMDNSLSFENPSSELISLKIKTSKECVNTNTFEISKTSQKKYFTEAEFEDLKNYTKELATTAVSEILSGYVEPSPLAINSTDGHHECDRCELAGFCGLAKARLADGRRCDNKVSIASFINEEGEQNG